MSKYNAQAIYAAFAKPSTVVSKEENDLNININAEHEGDKGGDEPADVVAPVGADEVATVETEEVPVVEEEVEVAPVVEDTSGTPEAAELDVNDSGDEVEETEEQIEDISEAAEGLEGIVLTLAQISVEGHQVSPFTAQMLNNHYDFVVRKFPALKADNNRIASMEAWSVSQEDAGTVSLEKVMDSIKNAGAAAAQFLKELLQQFLTLLGNVVSAAAVMKRKADELVKSSSTFKDTPREVSVPGLLTTKDLNAASINELAKALDVVTSINFTKYVTPEAIDRGAVENTAGPLADAVKVLFGETFIGGFKIENTTKGATVTIVEGKTDAKAKFSTSELNQIAKATSGLADSIAAYKRGEAARRNVVKEVTALSEKLNASNNGEDAGKVRVVRTIIRALANQIAFERRLVGRAIAAGNAINNVVASSLKAAPAEKAE